MSRKQKVSNVVNIFNQTTNRNSTPKLRKENLYNFDPLTTNQRAFYDLYDHDAPFILLSGFAGTGKTFIACYKALEQILSKNQPVKKIVIIRSSVQSRDMGHLPGDAKEKMSAFETPYKQITKDLFGRGDAWHLLKEGGQVEFESTSFFRGTTFHNSVIIVDECQSLNFHEVSTICSRIGQNSRLVFCGDFRQNDLIKTKNDQTGFFKFLEVAKLMPSYRAIDFQIEDIVRSGICKEWILAEHKWSINMTTAKI